MDIASLQGFGLQPQDSARPQASSGSVKGAYAQILQQKLDNLKEDLEEMDQRRQELRELEEAQEELTGNSDGEGNPMASTETIQRFLPDGTIVVQTVENGEVTEQFKKTPQMMPVPDMSAPKPEDGGTPSQQVKWMPHYSVMDMLSVR